MAVEIGDKSRVLHVITAAIIQEFKKLKHIEYYQNLF